MSDEDWRAIAGYEGLYEVSDAGRVRRLRRRHGTGSTVLAMPELLTPKRTGKGYLGVTLARDGKKRRAYVHRLVLRAFRGPPPISTMEGAHRDGVRSHNWLENLRWATRKDNHADKREHGTLPVGEAVHNAKLTEPQVRAIRCDAEALPAVAEKYGVSPSLISQIKRRRIWAHVI